MVERNGRRVLFIEWFVINSRVFPDYFYTFSLWQNDQQKKLVDFVMIDTVVLCGGDSLSDWDHRPLTGPKEPRVAEDYWQWIEQQLHQSTYVLICR
jgi:hypothetical protein